MKLKMRNIFITLVPILFVVCCNQPKNINEAKAEFDIIYLLVDKYVTESNELLILNELIKKGEYEKASDILKKLIVAKNESYSNIEELIHNFERKYTSQSEYMNKLKQRLYQQEIMIDSLILNK